MIISFELTSIATIELRCVTCFIPALKAGHLCSTTLLNKKYSIPQNCGVLSVLMGAFTEAD